MPIYPFQSRDWSPRSIFRSSGFWLLVVAWFQFDCNVALKGADAQAASLKNEAVEVAKALADQHQRNPLAQVLLGSAFYNTGRSDEATRYLERGLALQPDLLEAYEVLARISYEKGQPEESIRQCRTAIDRGLLSSEILNRLGRSLLDLGETEEAIKILGRAIAQPGASVESHYLHGQAQLQSRNYEQAKAAFAEVVKRQKDHTQAYFGLFTASLRMGDAEGAQKYREIFVRLEEGDRQNLTDRSDDDSSLSGLDMVKQTVARTLFGAGQLYQEQGQPGKAGDLLLRACSLDGDNLIFKSGLEAYYLKGKDLNGGLEAFGKLIVQQPGNPLNYYYMGRFEARRKGFKAAREHYEKVQQLAPGWSGGFRGMVELCLSSQQNYPLALTSAEKAVTLEPSESNYYLLALANLRNRNASGALMAIEEALNRNPQNAKYLELRRRLRAAVGGAAK